MNTFPLCSSFIGPADLQKIKLPLTNLQAGQYYRYDTGENN